MHKTIRDPYPQPTSTIGAIERRRCVRCGELPPAPELFVCGRCEADPELRSEQLVVEENLTDYKAQRRALVETFGWRGGWWHL